MSEFENQSRDLDFYREKIREIVASRHFRADMSDEEYRSNIKKITYEEIGGKDFSLNEIYSIIDYIFNKTRGLGPLQPIIDDKSITEIMVNGVENTFIEKAGQLMEIDLKFENQAELERIVSKIVQDVNRQINQSSPIVDARLKDGSRINAVFPPIALNGPILTIRKFPEKPLSMEQLIAWKSITPEAAEFLKKMVKARYNIFISGGTGSGKTTFLNMLSNFIPKDERVITIEDSAELQIQGVANLPRLEARMGEKDASTNISIRDLIKSSLRMRPDRIVVGEVRGAEALDMLQAMNTGHDGSLSTGHANSAIDMLSRLETMVLMAVDLPLPAIRQQIASAIDIIVHLSRLRDKSRRVVEISEVLRLGKDGVIEMNKLYEFVETGIDENEKVVGILKRTDNKMENTLKSRAAGIKEEF